MYPLILVRYPQLVALPVVLLLLEALLVFQDLPLLLLRITRQFLSVHSLMKLAFVAYVRGVV
jgi:hypothetical protein